MISITIVYIMISVLGGAAGQIMLKRGMSSMGALTLNAGQVGPILWRMGTNPFVIGGLAIYAASTIFWLLALSRVDLSYAYPFASMSYVIMLIAAWQLFGENITFLRLAGSAVIMLGVLLISRS
jgi:drug/metabolite transporter (DMT)-like permease